MTYNIIGTGNTAWFMATRLTAAGHKCMAIYGRNLLRAQELANTVNANAYELKNGINDNADVCIIAISDHVISEIVPTLNLKKTILIHTAGAVDADVLSSIPAGYGVIWPIYSIVKDNLPKGRNIPTVWEASNQQASEIVKNIADSYTDILFEANSEQRRWLHLSAVLSNNFTNHLYTISERLCEEQKLPFTLLLPIIQQTVSRLADTTAFSQQTGPAKRNDDIVLQNHIQMLGKNPEWQQLYHAISESIMHMYNNHS